MKLSTFEMLETSDKCLKTDLQLILNRLIDKHIVDINPPRSSSAS